MSPSFVKHGSKHSADVKSCVETKINLIPSLYLLKDLYDTLNNFHLRSGLLSVKFFEELKQSLNKR